MPLIERVVLQNFKRFAKRLELHLSPDLNVLIGDNEAGKSTVLLGIELVLAASRSRIEHIGMDTLLPVETVEAFLNGSRCFGDLPEVRVELFLSPGPNPDYNGKGNSELRECDGLKMVCAVPEEHSRAVSEILKDANAPFPYEYYFCHFSTFADHPYFGSKKHIRHLLLDSSRIDSEHAAREYTRALFAANSSATERFRLQSAYRQAKLEFVDQHLKDTNQRTDGFSFGVRTSSRANLETDLSIHESSLPLELRGKGRQCQIKTEFALKRGSGDGLDVLLLEEPENHLSHTSTRKLIDQLSPPGGPQIVLTTHSSLITSRLDLRKAQLISASSKRVTTLRDVDAGTAAFFMKAPDNHVLEFALSTRVILVEGDAEFILMEMMYAQVSGSTLAADRVHVISVGGTSFKRYLHLAQRLNVRTAVIRDNDGDHVANCVDNYAAFDAEHVAVFGDRDRARKTFEIALYQDNTALCEELFASDRRRLSVQDYMLANKTDAAFELLSRAGDRLKVPAYICEAISWIKC